MKGILESMWAGALEGREPGAEVVPARGGQTGCDQLRETERDSFYVCHEVGVPPREGAWELPEPRNHGPRA